jgi:hypothetical protein
MKNVKDVWMINRVINALQIFTFKIINVQNVLWSVLIVLNLKMHSLVCTVRTIVLVIKFNFTLKRINSKKHLQFTFKEQ